MTSPAPTRRTVEMPAGLRISAYDRVAGTIVALLVIVGFGVTVLVLLWLAGRALAANQQPPVELLPEEVAGMTASGNDQQMVEPGVEEFSDVQPPQLADTLAAVTNSVTTQQATLDELFGDDAAVGSGAGRGHRDASGTGGDNDGATREPPERLLSLNVRNLTAYARLLDALQVEMGVLGGGIDGIVYISKLSAEKPVVRSGTGDAENRLYFPQDSALAELDGQLLAKAGIAHADRVVVYFVPRTVENQILLAERQHADLPPEKLLRTTFGVRAIDDGYAFYVIRQEPRP